MTDFFQEPCATCPVFHRPPPELLPWTCHMVSMMQALQASTRLTVYPDRIVWNTADGATFGFTNCQSGGQFRNVGVRNDIGLVQGMELDEHVEVMFVMTEDLLDATKDSMLVASGRRTDPNGQYHGYVVWQRTRTPNHPRIEISPDQVIILWYHRPDGDYQPSASPHH